MNLYTILCTFFCLIAVLSNIISAKMMQLPFTELHVPAGLITYPLTFLLADLVTEIYGQEKAKQMVYVTLALSILSYGIIQLALLLPSKNEQAAFQEAFGLSGLRIFASLTAYLISQVVDIRLYSGIKKITGTRYLWLRNNGSTCISQLVDTILVDLIYLYWGLHMGMIEIFPIMLISYSYKAFFGILSTPLFYLSVFLSKRSISRST